MPMDLGAAREPLVEHLGTPDVPWVEPIPDAELGSPEHAVFTRESIRLAFVIAMQRLPARQRAVLLLRDVMGWSVAEVAELLEASEQSINSALQRARATLDEHSIRRERISAANAAADPATRAHLDRFVAAFERYEMDELAGLLREHVEQAMRPFDLWFVGREDVPGWWFGPGVSCAGSRLPAAAAPGEEEATAAGAATVERKGRRPPCAAGRTATGPHSSSRISFARWNPSPSEALELAVDAACRFSSSSAGRR
jgi:RNA polymerase sigma-70 factor, ECF subfamily